MINIGHQVRTAAFCPTCGHEISNNLRPPSAFIFGFCGNQECEDKGVGLLIERATMLVVMVNPPQFWVKPGERAYPVLANKDGEQVWPEKDFCLKMPG